MQKRSPVEESWVVVVPYDARWPCFFEAEASRLRPMLGSDLVAIEHIGSTSVPGLASKPIVDILVASRATGAPAKEDVATLASLGYGFLGEDGRRPGRFMFRKRGTIHFNLSVVPAGSALWRDNLMLRDFLREQPHEAAAYAAVKRRAAELSPDSLLGYQDLKRTHVQALLQRARRAGEAR